MNILIIKLGAIGDVIRTTSILPALKSKYLDCKIDWVTKKESFDVLKNINLISNIYLINDLDALKNKEYDLIISLDDDNEACTLAKEIKSKKIIGAYSENDKRTYTNDSSSWFDMGLISKFGKQKADKLKVQNKKTYQEIIYRILDLDYKKQLPILNLGKEINFARNFAQKNSIKNKDLVIGINTGAGERWQDKKLSEQETAELIDKLNAQVKCKLLLFGGPEEKKRNKEITNKLDFDIMDAGCDNTLLEFASLINLCNVIITSDSLAMHIGTALKKKIICFFYATSAQEIELYGYGIKIIGKGKDYCSYKPKCGFPPEWDINEFVEAVKKLTN